MNTTITAPSGLTGTEACALLAELAETAADHTTLDLSRIQHATPAGLLTLGLGYRQLVRQRTQAGRVLDFHRDTSSKADAYLDYMGLYRLLSAQSLGSGDRHSAGSYMAITALYRVDLEESAEGLTDALESRARQLAGIVCGEGGSTALLLAVTYTLHEMLRNTFEHSGAHAAYVCGQRWPQKREAEVVVADTGSGIAATLGSLLGLSNSVDVLREAIKPGVSRAADAESNPHGNSGFGLYVTSELGRRAGRFSLLSSGARLAVGRTSKSESIVDAAQYQGTIVTMRLSDAHVESQSSELHRIIADGEDEARAAGRTLVPSRSRMGR